MQVGQRSAFRACDCPARSAGVDARRLRSADRRPAHVGLEPVAALERVRRRTAPVVGRQQREVRAATSAPVQVIDAPGLLVKAALARDAAAHRAARAASASRGLLLQRRGSGARSSRARRPRPRSASRRPRRSPRPCSRARAAPTGGSADTARCARGPSCVLPSCLLTARMRSARRVAARRRRLSLWRRSATMSTPCPAALRSKSCSRASRRTMRDEQRHRARMLELLERARRSVRAQPLRAGPLHRERLRALRRTATRCC